MLYFICILATSWNYAFIQLGSLQRALWKLQARIICVLSLGQRCTKRYAYCLPTGFAQYIAKREFAISSTLLTQGGNPRISRSRMYRISVSSSEEVKLYQGFRISAIAGMPFIRLQREDLETLYIFATCQRDKFLDVQIASMARMILPSWVCTDIVLWWSCCVQQLEGRDVVGKCAD